MARQAVLGGEVTKRGLWGGGRNTYEWYGVMVFLAGAVAVAFSAEGNWWGLAAGLVIAAAGVAAFTPWAATGDLSPASRAIMSGRHRYRNMAGRSVFIPPGSEEHVPERKWWQRRPKVEFSAPDSVGDMRWFDVNLSGGGSIVVFRHNLVRGAYYSAVLEVTGTAGGVKTEDGIDEAYIGWGETLSALASSRSLIEGVQQVARAVPMDSSDHLAWVKKQIVPEAHELLVASYGELIDLTQSQSEQHRAYVAVSIPAGPKLRKKAARYGHGDEGIGAAVFEEVKLASSRLRAGGMSGVRALGQSHAAALFRSLQDPSYDIDDLDGADLATCWQKTNGQPADHAVINDCWFTKVAYVPPRAIAPDAQPVQMLSGLVTGVNPSVVHTVSSVHRLIDARKARTQARGDYATDKAARDKAGRADIVTDGTEDVLYNASKQRHLDLKMGSPYHGTQFGLYISVTAGSVEDLEEATETMEIAANDCGISHLSWLDKRHDLGLITCLPLMRGIRDK